ncbi:MAG: DUF4080 domain-containing protein, partial [Pseudomonadota bacterium]
TVQQTINRKQHEQKTLANLQWLRQQTNAYIHADLIVGLPGETLESFAAGFNQLVALQPHEIQVGILKRLRGTTIVRHTETYDMCYATSPPYQLLRNRDLDFPTMQNMQRFARYWDLIANSSRFTRSLPLILGTDAFGRFFALSDWIFQRCGQTHRLSQKRLFSLLFDAAQELSLCSDDKLTIALTQDFEHSGEKGKPPWQIVRRAEKNHRRGDHAKRQTRQSARTLASIPIATGE